ncbi:hypothetical protein AB0C13_33480 [Streptomyces sp. NPDC049099]|uniref:hypothetical protein n=1 Tax=Streptomyces sp. NPDC049099 TaxID=3155768 RepID=UPI0034486E96
MTLLGELDFEVGDALVGKADVVAGGGEFFVQGLALRGRLTGSFREIAVLRSEPDDVRAQSL